MLAGDFSKNFIFNDDFEKKSQKAFGRKTLKCYFCTPNVIVGEDAR
jgi:hypothetical protein